MAWRLAGSLVVLRNEINQLAPKRSKASDGFIGDPAHRARCSTHNPNAFGVVTGGDFTDDPGGGCPIHDIARRIARKPHPELRYIISNRQIAGRSTGWRWHAYKGSNPHVKHAHFGVGTGTDCDPRPPYDSKQSWGLFVPEPPKEESTLSAKEVEEIKRYIDAKVKVAVPILARAPGQHEVWVVTPGVGKWHVQGWELAKVLAIMGVAHKGFGSSGNPIPYDTLSEEMLNKFPTIPPVVEAPPPVE